jgi:hypothetical protein
MRNPTYAWILIGVVVGALVILGGLCLRRRWRV